MLGRCRLLLQAASSVALVWRLGLVVGLGFSFVYVLFLVVFYFCVF